MIFRGAIIFQMIATDLKTGTIYQENGQPLLVVKYEHVKVSRGGATVKVKTKNLATGQVLDRGYHSTVKVEDANVYRKSAQYLYEDNGYVFMDPESYEQLTISKDLMGDGYKYLVSGDTVHLQYFEGKPITIDLPIKMVFEIMYTEPGFKGNTVSNVFKDATINTGASVKVPMFIKIGDKVKIDTRTGEYVSKA